MLIGKLLNFLFGPVIVIFGDILALQQLLEVVIRVPADVADGDFGVSPSW